MTFLMVDSLILKVTKFQLPPPERLSTVVKNILGGHHAPPPMSNRINIIRMLEQNGNESMVLSRQTSINLITLY